MKEVDSDEQIVRFLQASAGVVSAAPGQSDKTAALKVYTNHFDQRDKRLRECAEAVARQREQARNRS